MSQIPSEQFTKALLTVLDEAMDQVHGYFLDPDNSLFTTLAGISAEEASIPVGGKCATLAAQVKHVAFYLDVLTRYALDQSYPSPDWGEIWRTVSVVSPEEWLAIQAELRRAYERLLALIQTTPAWSDNEIGSAFGLVAHTAYHLGEIRQALCTIKA